MGVRARYFAAQSDCGCGEHDQSAYDLFIGEVTGAWADSRVFQNGHWNFEAADPGLRSLHYIAGGQFYAIGDSVIAGTRSR